MIFFFWYKAYPGCPLGSLGTRKETCEASAEAFVSFLNITQCRTMGCSKPIAGKVPSKFKLHSVSSPVLSGKEQLPM